MRDVALGLSCLPKAAVIPQKLRVESKGQDKSRGMCWYVLGREGSSYRQCIKSIKVAGSFWPGDKPCLGSEKLAQTETGTARV